jgi:hypothetical protein
MVKDSTIAGAETGKWSSDAFLDQLRQQGDPLADTCIADLAPLLRARDFQALFRRLDRNAAAIPGDVPESLARYLDQACVLPRIDGGPVDMARIERGQAVFMTHLFPACAVLLLKSLPEGYAAPNLSRVLAETGNMERRTYRRLLGVLQLLLNVSTPGGFGPQGKALVTLAKVRLLHASVRRLVHHTLPDYEKRYGTPVNIEDMLGTIMGFSYLVVAGLERLQIALAPEEAADFYYVWCAAGLLMGIHPAGEPENSAWLPPDLASAALFYESYSRRHYVEARENPAGVVLARADLAVIDRILPPTLLSRLGFRPVPRLLMEALMDQVAMARVGVRPVRGLPILRFLILALPVLWSRIWRHLDDFDPTGRRHTELSARFFGDLIRLGRGEEVTFALPDNLKEFEAL